MDCLRVMQEFPHWHYRLGQVAKKIEGLAGGNYEPGEFVLYLNRPGGDMTVETPMPEEHYSDGHCGLLRTWGTISCVPHHYVTPLDKKGPHPCIGCEQHGRDGFDCWVSTYCGCIPKFTSDHYGDHCADRREKGGA